MISHPLFLSRLCGGKQQNTTMISHPLFLSRLCGGKLNQVRSTSVLLGIQDTQSTSLFQN
jgi:hypothetical protein